MEYLGQFVLACAEAQRVNTLKYSTCSHKWWETLKGLIFGVKASIPALMGPEGGLVVAPTEKASLLDHLFDSKQYCDQFVTPLSCFPQSRCNYLAFCPTASAS